MYSFLTVGLHCARFRVWVSRSLVLQSMHFDGPISNTGAFKRVEAAKYSRSSVNGGNHSGHKSLSEACVSKQ